MSAPDKLAYRSTHPDALATWDQSHADRRSWRERVDAWVAAHGPGGGRPWLISASFLGEQFAGFRPVDGDVAAPPEGWRVERGYLEPVLVPDRRRAAGRRLQEGMKALGICSHPRLPGMPREVFGTGRSYRPGMRRQADAIYVTWSGQADPEVDGTYWERIPLSTYYAAIEAADSPAA
ncbi:MAG TPA: hypothetical protein VGW74_08000 [Propionibacteriaceae bacterium]|nr:hypothetical protein [Propionibacteriaceae bacterium]